jgi:hypothetical protein
MICDAFNNTAQLFHSFPSAAPQEQFSALTKTAPQEQFCAGEGRPAARGRSPRADYPFFAKKTNRPALRGPDPGSRISDHTMSS